MTRLHELPSPDERQPITREQLVAGGGKRRPLQPPSPAATSDAKDVPIGVTLFTNYEIENELKIATDPSLSDETVRVTITAVEGFARSLCKTEQEIVSVLSAILSRLTKDS